MSSERDQIRFSGRRASLEVAMRDADVVVAARAASRLRVDGFPLTPHEFARARSMRRAAGFRGLQRCRSYLALATSAKRVRRANPDRYQSESPCGMLISYLISYYFSISYFGTPYRLQSSKFTSNTFTNFSPARPAKAAEALNCKS